MKRTALLLAAAVLSLTSRALSVEEARANLFAARAAYTNALHEAGITNTPRRARQRVKTSTAKTTATGSGVLTKRQQSFFENRRICVRRDVETMPGYVISYWERNGKPDTIGPAVVTNALQHLAGAAQHNPIQELAERYRIASTNFQARVERVTAALDERRAEYVQKRDAAALPTTKALYQAFIDAIDNIRQRMGVSDE